MSVQSFHLQPQSACAARLSLINPQLGRRFTIFQVEKRTAIPARTLRHYARLKRIPAHRSGKLWYIWEVDIASIRETWEHRYGG